MAYHRHLRLLCLTFILLTTLTAGDDGAVMSKFAGTLSPKPSSWTGTDYCKWDGITCDGSSRVTTINLASKSLAGTLIPEIKELTQLKTLAVQHNSFSGDIPILSSLTSIQQIFLDFNNFTSIPHDFFSGLNNLQSFSISDNKDLSEWVLPETLNQNTNLQTFVASNAKIIGSIPNIFDKLVNLQNLTLSYNNLTGTLPETFGGSQIQNLVLNNQVKGQGLSGNLNVISSMTQVSQVWLHGNAFTGVIPDLSNCTSLSDLKLSENGLTGLVPKTLYDLPSLKNVSLKNNKLQGELPVFKTGVTVDDKLYDTNSFCLSTPGPCHPQVTTLLEVAGAIGYPILLAQSWRGNDACNNSNRWNYISCDSNGNVITVSLGKHNFSGTISPAFANLTSLRSLSLNDNNFSGSIPEELTTLPNLVSLDVSNNSLSGKVPVFPAKVKFTDAGNPLLGQDVSTGSGSGNAGGSKKAGSGSTGMVVGVVTGVVVVVVFMSFVCYKCYVKKRNEKTIKVVDVENGNEIVKASNANKVVSKLHSQSSSDHTELAVYEGGNVNISIEILKEATDNFNEEKILGKGGFGVVYKGELHDGTKIAVKRMESGVMGTKGLQEFEAEIAVLTKVRHRHLVSLLGFCINGNERLLVYEYMPQGTLSQHLFECRETGINSLSWKQRVCIALDVGRGIEYLHSLAQQSFIHRDLKSSNILLSDDMRAKVADFGLVKNAPDGMYSVETRVAGTFGYLAPEYAVTGRVTTKVDVYAFGVVLMELITGRKALDGTMPDDRTHLVTWFRKVLISKENLVKAIDQTLDTTDEETLESIFKVAELAGHCTAREPYQRPDMGHAVNVLGPLVKQWKPSRPEEEDGNGVDLRMSLPQILQRWQDEGTSRMFDYSLDQTQSSIPSKPSGLADDLDSTEAR
ncbi:receptor-like kinase TMK4 [Rutidosis leptorrhynchoides]|uniref:receptor-like kinase TMK4 n=1 Tax=Rutidosis leptorrhynchoides TaxID=125765 RepID=UPI003A99F67E